MKAGWVKTNSRHPKSGQRVIAHYAGAYNYRLVTFWKDVDGCHHYGDLNEVDGKGSEPATHWHALPKLPR